MKTWSAFLCPIFFVPILFSNCNIPSGNGLNACALGGISVATEGFSGATSSVVASALAQWNNCNNQIPNFGSTGKASITIRLISGSSGSSAAASWFNNGASGEITLYTQSSSGATYSTSDLEYHLAHELGHALGLGHVDNDDCLMHINNNSRTRSVRTGDCTSTASLWQAASHLPDNEDCVNQLKTYGDCNSPLVIDTERNGFLFGGPEHGVLFDLLGVNHQINMQWVVPNGDDAFLVHDVNGNGEVDNGSELFGNGTRLVLQGNALAKNGFEGLAQWDLNQLGGNENGVIDPNDAVWSVLFLWLDANADGISQPSEMRDPADLGLSRIGLKYKDWKSMDEHGNILRFWAKAFKDSGPSKKFNVVDVFFKPVSE